MDDLSKRLREMAVQRETVTPDEHGVRILSAILRRNKRLMTKAADALDARDAEVGRLWEASKGCAASLAATISLLENGGKKAAPSDKMFAVMLDDYRKSLEEYRAAMKGQSTSHWSPLPPPPEDA